MAPKMKTRHLPPPKDIRNGLSEDAVLKQRSYQTSPRQPAGQVKEVVLLTHFPQYIQNSKGNQTRNEARFPPNLQKKFSCSRRFKIQDDVTFYALPYLHLFQNNSFYFSPVNKIDVEADVPCFSWGQTCPDLGSGRQKNHGTEPLERATYSESVLEGRLTAVLVATK